MCKKKKDRAILHVFCLLGVKNMCTSGPVPAGFNHSVNLSQTYRVGRASYTCLLGAKNMCAAGPVPAGLNHSVTLSQTFRVGRASKKKKRDRAILHAFLRFKNVSTPNARFFAFSSLARHFFLLTSTGSFSFLFFPRSCY